MQYFRYDALGRMTAAASTAVGSGGYGNQAWGITFYGGAGSIPGSGTAYYAYDAASRRTKTLLGNGAAAYFSYDAANRLLSQKSILPGGAALTYFNYGYDAASRIVKIGREGGKTIYYSYDGADRLTGENWYNSGMQNVYAFAWSYDAVGNRRWQNRLGQQSYFTYDAANALRKSFPVGGSATYYSYDLNGNCTKIAAPASQTTYFAYNSVNLMTQVTFRNGVSNYFYYDALNRRRALLDSNGPAYFMYDRDGLCQLVERSITGTVRAEYTRGSAPVPGIGDMVAAKINTSTTSYYQYPVYDQPGNVRRILNAAGAVTGSFEYNAFGELLLNNPPPEGTRFGFSVPAWIMLKDDPDGRFVLTPTRTGNLAMGRFLQKDPVPTDGENPYAYARNNPVLWTDAEGHQAGDVVVGGEEVGVSVLEAIAAALGISVGALLAILVLSGIAAYLLWRLIRKWSRKARCLPCQPPVGTIAYRVDCDGRAHAGVPTPHSQAYEMHQSPPSSGCVCFWHRTGVILPGVFGPPMVPAGGGGVVFD